MLLCWKCCVSYSSELLTDAWRTSDWSHRHPSLTNNDPRLDRASACSGHSLAVLPTRGTNAHNMLASFCLVTLSQLIKGLLGRCKPHRNIRRGRTTCRFLRLTRWNASIVLLAGCPGAYCDCRVELLLLAISEVSGKSVKGSIVLHSPRSESKNKRL